MNNIDLNSALPYLRTKADISTLNNTTSAAKTDAMPTRVTDAPVNVALEDYLNTFKNAPAWSASEPRNFQAWQENLQTWQADADASYQSFHQHMDTDKNQKMLANYQLKTLLDNPDLRNGIPTTEIQRPMAKISDHVNTLNAMFTPNPIETESIQDQWNALDTSRFDSAEPSRITDRERLEEMAKFIDDIKHHYVDTFANGTEVNADFFKAISDLVTLIGANTTSAGDKVTINSTVILAEIDRLLALYVPVIAKELKVKESDNNLYVPRYNTTNLSAATQEAQAWCDLRGISRDYIYVYWLPSGGFSVSVKAPANDGTHPFVSTKANPDEAKAEALQWARDHGFPDNAVRVIDNGANNGLMTGYTYAVIRVSTTPSQVLFSSTNPDLAAAKLEAEKWAKILGVSETCVQLVDGKYRVLVDTSPLLKIKETIVGKGEMTAKDYDNWQLGFNAQKEVMQNTMQVMTEKFSRANAEYDNAAKLFSSMIASNLETRRAMLA